jgi:RHS repeat-associated protein
MVDADGQVSLAQSYEPFGETLSSSGEGSTSYGFTGEWTDSYSGLVNLRARYYAPWQGRFLSRDAWEGDSFAPLSYNLWLYTYANPINLTDPSGFTTCGIETRSDFSYRDACDEMPLEAQPLPGSRQYNIKFIDTDEGTWSPENRFHACVAAIRVGWAFAHQASIPISGNAAFNAIYNVTVDEPLKFVWGNCPQCFGGGGFTKSSHEIRFASLSTLDNLRPKNNVIHELGHAFDWAMKATVGEDLMPRNVLNRYWKTNPFPRRPKEPDINDANYYGLAGPRNQTTWHQNPIGDPNEEFADTFLAWVSNAWETNSIGKPTIAAQDRINFMNAWMPLWVNTGIIR